MRNPSTAKPHLRCATMNAGQSTALLQAAPHCEERGMAVRQFTAGLGLRAVKGLAGYDQDDELGPGAAPGLFG